MKCETNGAVRQEVNDYWKTHACGTLNLSRHVIPACNFPCFTSTASTACFAQLVAPTWSGRVRGGAGWGSRNTHLRAFQEDCVMERHAKIRLTISKHCTLLSLSLMANKGAVRAIFAPPQPAIRRKQEEKSHDPLTRQSSPMAAVQQCPQRRSEHENS